MAGREPTTYIKVPPPPLPEFYKHRQHDKDSSSSSATKVEKETIKLKETITSMDGQYDGRPGFVPPTPLRTVPRPPDSNDVPPLAIYHICRICLRPRSARYHREHPIPLDGVPPPPGICRRCRVTSLEEIKRVTDVVVKSESNPIKLGCITPFVPDKDIISNEDMRRMKVEKYLRGTSDQRGASRRRSDSRKDIVYRHVKVVDEPSVEESSEDEEVVEQIFEEVVIPRKKKVIFTAREAVSRFSNTPFPEPPTAPRTTTMSMQVQPTDNPPSLSSASSKTEQLRKKDSTKTSVSARASSTSRSGSTSTVRASAKASVKSQPGYTASDIRRVARGEIEEYAKKMQQPGERHKEIRKLAREEVERYRQAERKLEAHPDAYAHGKLVQVIPVERRIEVERDTVKAMPWMQSTFKEESVTKASSKQTSGTAQRDFTYEPTSDIPRGRTASATSRGSVKWDRELSIERRSHRQVNPRSTESDKDNIAKEYATNEQESAKSRELNARHQESNPRRSKTTPNRYIVEVSKQHPEEQRNVSELVEEMDLPPRSKATSYRRYEYDSRRSTAPDQSVTEKDRESPSNAGQNEFASKAAENAMEKKWSGSANRPDTNYWPDDASIRTAKTQSFKQSAVGAAATQNSTARTPFPSPVIEHSTHASTHSRVTFQDDQASDKTRWSRRHRMAEEGRGGGTESAKELPYPEVSGMPDPSDTGASQHRLAPPSSSKKDSDREYLYIEHTVQPADRPSGSRPFDHGSPMERIVEEETYVVRRRPEGGPRRRRRESDDRRQRESDESNHVKFNKKVDISPTPPGSDASSSEFRSFHSIGPRSGRQIDGNDDSGRPGDVIGEYERRGRTRSRGSETQYFHERETIHETADGVVTVKPGERRRGGGSGRQAAWISGSRPLERPLSESPSREEIIPPSQFSKSDGKGPYREYGHLTDSMHAQNGSPGKRGWQDGVGGSMHSSIGQAAQVSW